MKNIIPFIGILLAACGTGKQEPAATAAEKPLNTNEISLTEVQWKNAAITVEPVVDAAINRTLRLSGTIDVPPQNLVSITCPLGGYLKSIHLLPGEEVSKGQEIAVMEDPSFIQLQQDYLVEKARLEFLQQEYSRQKGLAATEASSQKQFQQVQSDLTTAQVMLKGLEQKLALIGINAGKLTSDNISRSIAIRSPIHGFVTKVNVNVGRYVNPTDVMVELVDPGDIHASINVYEKDIAQIKKNQAVRVTLLNNPDRVYPAEVLLVTRNLNEDRMGQIHCHFEKYDPGLMPGMFINAEIELGAQHMPAVPEEAMVRHQGQFYVFVETGTRKYALTKVDPGEREGGKIGILNADSTLSGKMVVTKNAFVMLGMMMNSGEEE